MLASAARGRNATSAVTHIRVVHTALSLLVNLRHHLARHFNGWAARHDLRKRQGEHRRWEGRAGKPPLDQHASASLPLWRVEPNRLRQQSTHALTFTRSAAVMYPSPSLSNWSNDFLTCEVEGGEQQRSATPSQGGTHTTHTEGGGLNSFLPL